MSFSQFSQNRLIVVEIRTIDNPGFDSAQIKTIDLHEGEEAFYLDFSWADAIASALINAILCLGSNFRHPLLFRIQVIPFENTLESTPPRRRRKRRGKEN